ncbi:MAG: tRNA (guanine(46)-N(7))-methyltransferase TrmB [Hyphomicrobiales bacterium]|jgi:tRNA (guanine-N7-)-methyltransferase|nr:tRNA (guanine(46)-N(7))-methyltransferase TrmB [Hyphomicrobiales bacterium]
MPETPARSGTARPPTGAGGSFFGRRKAKKLRGGQSDLFETLLPRLILPDSLPDDLGALFASPPREVRLEIGFGGGEHLLAAARAEPDVGFIGCEPFINGMAKMLAAIQREGLDNLRLWPDDAAPLLRRLPAASLSRVDLFYPDPWPKRRQRKRRFVSPETLALISRVLRAGSSFRFASDIDDYVGWTLRRIAAEESLIWAPVSAKEWTEPFEGWVRTRYEAKAIAAGRVPSYLAVRRAGL